MEPHRIGRIRHPPRPGQHTDRGVEPEAPRLRPQPAQHGTALHARLVHASTRVPLRAGQAAADAGAAAQTDAGAREAVHRAMQGKEVLQHRGEQIQAAGLPGTRVEFQRDIEAAAKAAGAAGRTGGTGTGAYAGQRFDGGAGLRGVAQVVEPQHLLQRSSSFRPAGDRKVAQRQVRHQAPEAGLAQRWAQGGRGGSDRVQRGDSGGALDQAQTRMAAAERQVGGQVAIDALRVDRQHRLGRLVRVEVGIVRCEEHLGARHARGGRAAWQMVEATRHVGFRIPLRQPVERPPRAERAVRQRLAHPLDTPDFRRARPPCISDDPVFDILVAERHRLAALVKQIDQRRAAEGERRLADGAFQFGQRAIQIDEDLQPVAGGHQRLGVDPGDVEEQELLREGEVLGEQAEAGKSARRPGQQCLVRGEADRLDRAGRHDDRRRVHRVVGEGN